ncbi:hypothetical protein ABVF61_01235 [Roseibium sp. HPY-6]|uniref:hypothetical protein n=1 Tax=Roseibium sp. HPY-6 TaxID=3229852 RepID=UPI00338E3355
MKIRQENNELLVLTDTPWLPVFVAFCLCALFGYAVWTGMLPDGRFPWLFLLLPPLVLGATIFYFESIKVVFDTRTGRININRRRLFRRESKQYELDKLSKIGLDGMPDSTGGTQRIMMYFDDIADPVPLTVYESNGQTMPNVAKRIEGWLARRAASVGKM